MIRIHRLPALVANQIAAGEVVERPASVVKELLENALDANADHISIEIVFGGLNEITISDNGEGISEADLHNAIHPHATSKIQTLADLASVKTMGFRGEALASIASVSRLRIQSKPATQAQAMELITEEEHIHLRPCARKTGTTLHVRELFYNAPVRKRFLKSARSEFLAIDRVVRCFALSAPHMAITFSHEGHCVFKVPAGTTEVLRLQRLHKLLGKSFIEAALSVEPSEGEITLSGWVTRPDYARSQKDRIWIYVNGRMVHDKLLNHAIKSAYEGNLPPGRYPACVLYLTLNPQDVDVNVHPTKHELRFHNPRLVHDALRARLASTLTSAKACLSSTAPVIRQDTAMAPSLGHHTASLDIEGRWIPLCQEYALIYRQQQPLLLDVSLLKKDCLLSQLRQCSRPLEARALLVPVSVQVPLASVASMESCLEGLANVGFTFTWIEDQRLLVRSVPIMVANLDIKAFILAVIQSHASEIEAIFQLLVKHQVLHAFSVTDMEKQNWLAYLVSCETALQSHYIRALSAEQCRRFFRESSPVIG